MPRIDEYLDNPEAPDPSDYKRVKFMKAYWAGETNLTEKSVDDQIEELEAFRKPAKCDYCPDLVVHEVSGKPTCEEHQYLAQQAEKPGLTISEEIATLSVDTELLTPVEPPQKKARPKRERSQYRRKKGDPDHVYGNWNIYLEETPHGVAVGFQKQGEQGKVWLGVRFDGEFRSLNVMDYAEDWLRAQGEEIIEIPDPTGYKRPSYCLTCGRFVTDHRIGCRANKKVDLLERTSTRPTTTQRYADYQQPKLF